MLKIGSLKLSSPFILAPMAGVSDLPFRMLNRKFGCELAFIEMLNVRSLSYKSKRTSFMLSTEAGDRPLGMQILGKEPRFILRGLEVLKKYKFDILDFNAACPARKVVARQEGAALLREPKRLKELLKVVVKNSSVPVTVKIRSGWDENSVNAREVALYAEEAGISALFIHGRTRAQGYSGKVDYEAIRSVKKALKIPVIASGDIFSAALAKQMFEETGCDGVAIARGALGNPWIFKEISAFLKNGQVIQRPGLNEVIKVMVGHLNACVDYHGTRIGVVVFRKFFAWYTKGFRVVRVFREKACHAKTKEEMLRVIEEFGAAHR